MPVRQQQALQVPAEESAREPVPVQVRVSVPVLVLVRELVKDVIHRPMAVNPPPVMAHRQD